MDWFPEAVRLLRDELPNIDVIISSQISPELAGALLRGKVDVALLRPEEQMPDLAFKFLTTKPLVVVLPSDPSSACRRPLPLCGWSSMIILQSPGLLSRRITKPAVYPAVGGVRLA